MYYSVDSIGALILNFRIGENIYMTCFKSRALVIGERAAPQLWKIS